MKTIFYIRLLLIITPVFLCSTAIFCQTSWKGTSSTAWKTSANWTNGVPSSTVDAVIGDASFTGSKQPDVTATASCKSLTIGGTVTTTLTISRALTITGNLTINSNGTIIHKGTTASIKGNWSNSGTYSATSNSSLLNFIGVTQSIAGANVTAFRKITISTGCTVTLNKNITVTGGSSLLTVSGTLNPGESPTYTGTITALTVNNAGVLHVKATSFAGNYIVSGATTLNAGSIVDYSSITLNQTVSSTYTYATLKISGSGTKSLAANLPALRSTAAAEGNIYVNAGTFDLLGFTANRGTTTAGGIISVANNAILKIGGTNSFPVNYLTKTLVVASTVEYSGTAQTVTSLTYGNLSFSSSAGAVVKTLPATALTIAGNLSSMVGSGTAVSYTAAANTSINGNVSIGASTTYDGSSYSITAGGNWANSGSFTGATSTVTLTGPGSAISGAGVHNFYNLTLSASNITASAASNLTLAGNFSVTLGNFTHLPGGTFTMSGTGKTISGPGIVLDNLAITGSVTTAATLTLTGNLPVSGTLTAGSSTITMSGASKTISGAGSITLGTLSASGSISTAISFTVATGLSVSGSFTASAGTTSFTGTASFSGTANLYNVTLNGSSLQLASNAVLGIANNFVITAGTLNVTSSIPNTVKYNGTGAQNVNAITYNNLTVMNGNTKTAAGACTVNQDITIAAGTTFSGGAFTHIIYEDWINNGIFTAGTGTVQFSGTAITNIYGATTFNILTINNASPETEIVLQNNISAANVNMTMGKLLTGSNTITITTTRTGNGIILGNIQRTHAFTTGTAYAFEGPDNTISFASVSLVTSITVAVILGNINDFPFGASISRQYTISIPTGTYNATLRLHYDDANLNGNTEATMSLWKYNGSLWSSQGKSGNSTTLNYVEQAGLTDITNRWTCSDAAKVVRWNGGTSTDWNTAANWTIITGSPATPPSASDIVELGTAAFTNQPTITTAALSKNIIFGSTQAITLTLGSGGSLNTSGNIAGQWSANAVHSINVNNQALTVNGDLILSDGTNSHTIAMNIGTGTLTVAGSLTQSGAANIIFSGAGNLNIGKDYNYTSGTFTAATSTTTYNGATDQVVAGVSYNHLTINKPAGLGNINADATIGGNLLILSAELDNHAVTTIYGNTTISSGATFRNFLYLHPKGDWTNNGNYIATGASIYFDGSGTQYISASTFNNLNINKPVGSSAILTGNLVINGNLVISSGTLNIKTFNCNRSVPGGTVTLADPATLIVGANNLPLNFTAGSLSASSTVIADGTVPQSIFGESFGNLIFRNAGIKTLVSPLTVNGNLTIESGSTFDGGSETLTLNGNWINNGTFTPSTSLVICSGTTKTLSGTTSFNRLTVYGSYTLLNDITFNGLLNITSSGSFSAGGTINVTMNGDLINSGYLYTLGTTTYSGNVVQTLRLINAVATVALTVNFNGTVSPVLNSTSSPQFGYLNINNTGGINPSVDWTISYNMNVGSGASFNGGAGTHTFNGSLTNNGNISSSGTLQFVPAGAATVNMGSNFTSTGMVIFGGAGALTLAGSPSSLQNVLISNTNAAAISPSSNWNIANNFTINSNSIFNAGAYACTVGGDLESNGTLNGGTSAFTMSGAANLLFGSPGTTFYDLVITGSIASQSSFNVAHNFTNNNLFDASIGVVDFTGAGPSVIGGSASPYVLSQLGVFKTSGAAVTAGVNITAVDYLDIQSGVFDISTFTISENAGFGLMNIANNALLKINGTGTLPGFTTYAMDSLSTVDYAGTGTNIKSVSANAFVYGNLTISGTGTKTADGPLNIRNNFTLTNATFVAGNYTDTLGGNWNMASGAFTNTGSSLTLNGTGTQNMASTGSFNNVTINKTAGNAVLSTNITVNGILNFTLGKIQTGANTLVIPSGANLTGAAQGTGWVFGKLQKYFATGSNVARTMEIGDALSYTPATVAISSVSTAGNLTGSTTATEHTNITSSGINSNKSVNRFFSFSNSGIVFTNAAITVNWVAADLDAGVTTSLFKVGNYIGAAWSLPAVASPLATSIQATGITAFGDMAVGELITSANWTGSISSNWGTAGNWSSGAVPGSSTNTTIPTGMGTYPVLSSGTGMVNNLIIQTGATLTVTGAILQTGGSISNSGTFTVSSGTVELNGTTAQTIPAGAFASNTIQNLMVTNDVAMAGAVNITGTLSFGNTSGKTLSTGGFLTLKSTSAATARLADITNAGVNSGNAISGNVTMERYIKLRTPGTGDGTGNNGRAYRLLAPTVNTTGSIKANWMEGGMNTVIGTNVNPAANYGTQITGAAGNANGFDVTVSNASSLYAIANAVTPTYTAIGTTTGTLNALTGYFLYIRGDRSMNMQVPLGSNMPTSHTTLRTTGTLVTGTQTTFTNAFVGSGALNLVTNPYASPIDWSLVKAASSNITNYYTLWDPNVGTRGGFVTVHTNGTVNGGGTATINIQPGQAFFVESDGVGVPAVSIQEAHKTAGNNNTVFLVPPESFQTALYFIEDSGYRRMADGVNVMYDNSYSASVDADDAKEIGNWDENIAVNRAGKRLAIEARPVILNRDTIPLFMNNMKQRAYEFEFIPASFTHIGLKAELVDNFLNQRTLLSVVNTVRVVFNITADPASSATNRFMVVFGPQAPLAIDLLTIRAQVKYQPAAQGGNGVQVNWTAKTEKDMDRYELERSFNGTSFTKITTVLSAGNSTVPVNYNWLDMNPQTGNNFYRIKATDKAGLVKYTTVVQVNFGKAVPAVTVYPNPVGDNIINLQLTDIPKGTYTLLLVNNLGQTVYRTQVQHAGGSATIPLIPGSTLAKGVYGLVLGGENIHTTYRLVKN